MFTCFLIFSWEFRDAKTPEEGFYVKDIQKPLSGGKGKADRGSGSQPGMICPPAHPPLPRLMGGNVGRRFWMSQLQGGSATDIQ